MVRLLIWITNVLNWIAKWWRLGIALFPFLAGAVLLVLWFGAIEPALRWTGLFLQLMGIVTVLIGIRQTRVFFDQPGALARARLLFSQFPPFRSRHTTIMVELLQGRATAFGAGLVVGPAKSMSLEDRIKALES